MSRLVIEAVDLPASVLVLADDETAALDEEALFLLLPSLRDNAVLLPERAERVADERNETLGAAAAFLADRPVRPALPLRPKLFLLPRSLRPSLVAKFLSPP